MQGTHENEQLKAYFKELKFYQKGIAKLHGMIEQSKWTKAIDSLMTDGFLAKVEKFSTSSLLVKVLGFACEGFSGLKKHSETITYCSRVIDIESTTQARIARGEAYLARDDFENAKRDFKAAHDNDNQNQRVLTFTNIRLLMDTKKQRHF